MKNNNHICSFCNTEYKTAEERIKCEYSCLMKQEEEKKIQKKKEAEETKKRKIDEIKMQIGMMKDNEKTLYDEYVAICNKRRELEKQLIHLQKTDIDRDIFDLINMFF